MIIRFCLHLVFLLTLLNNCSLAKAVSWHVETQEVALYELPKFGLSIDVKTYKENCGQAEQVVIAYPKKSPSGTLLHNPSISLKINRVSMFNGPMYKLDYETVKSITDAFEDVSRKDLSFSMVCLNRELFSEAEIYFEGHNGNLVFLISLAEKNKQ